MDQPNAGSFWKDRYASHPGAGAEEPQSSFRDYWDQQRAGVQQGNAERKAAQIARRDASRAERHAGRGFRGVNPMPVVADDSGYGPPPPPPGSRPAVPNPGAGVGLGTGIRMDERQPAPPSGPQMAFQGKVGGGTTPPPRGPMPGLPVPARGAPGGRGGPPPVPARGAPGGRGGPPPPVRGAGGPMDGRPMSSSYTGFDPGRYAQGYRPPGGFNNVQRQQLA